MNHFRTLCLTLVCLASFADKANAQWTPPTPEELQMTAQPEVPGAAAVYLFREEITDDHLHDWSIYARIKILTEKGKDLANVELRQYEATERGGYTVNEIKGRTIHPDGTIIPFTGKPYEKLIDKTQGMKVMAKVFTLPDVQIGSIIEYRYNIRYDDHLFIAPEWYIQSDLFTRKAHYLWRPTSEQLVSKNERGEQLTSTIAWAPILPAGTQVTQKRLPPTDPLSSGQIVIEVNAHDIPPQPDEEYMPPIKSFTYRVLFYYSPYRTPAEYWKNEGKGWAKQQDKFIGPGPAVGAAVKDLSTPADTQDQKLRKLYAAVMQLDNSRFNRSRSVAEEKSEGLNPAKNTDDIWTRKRGTDDQLTQLFVAMARAAGMKAYVMTLTPRDNSLFNPNFLSFDQLQDSVAIVNVDGKEMFFDPGQRYTPYGHLEWKHTMAQGLRQNDGGTIIAGTPAESYKDSRIQRVADLAVDEHGAATGTVKMTWTGEPALNWRQARLRGDQTSFDRELRTAVERLLPGGTEVKLGAIDHLDDYEQPLTVNYTIKGQMAASTGKRLIIPSDIFESNATPAFPHEKRDIAVYFEYPQTMQDAVRIVYPPTLAVESQPTPTSIPFAKSAVYSVSSKPLANSLTTYRNFLRSEIMYLPAEYSDLRAFYTKCETKDQEPIILKAAATSTPGGN